MSVYIYRTSCPNEIFDSKIVSAKFRFDLTILTIYSPTRHHKTQYRPNSPHLRQNLSYSQLFETCKHLLLHLTYFTHNPWEFWKVEISSDFICFNPIDLTMKWCLIFSYLFKTLIGFLGKLTQFNFTSLRLKYQISIAGLDLRFNTTKFDQKMIRKKIRDLKLRKENPNNTCPHRRRWSVNGVTCDPKRQDTAAHPTAIQGNSTICDFVFILFNFLRHFDIDAFDWY